MPRDIIIRDAIRFRRGRFRTDLCAGTVTAIRGVPCMDIDYTDLRVLRGDFTPEERAFLFGVDKGHTIYKQNVAELSFGGELFNTSGGASPSCDGRTVAPRRNPRHAGRIHADRQCLSKALPRGSPLDT